MENLILFRGLSKDSSPVIAVLGALLVAVLLLLGGCNKDKRQTIVTTKGISHSVDTIVVQGDGVTFISTREGEWGKIHGTNTTTGETHDWVFPLGGANFQVTPHDTIVGSPVVNHGSFQTGVDSLAFDTLEVFHLIKRTINFTDNYDQYVLSGKVTWLDGSVDCWGYNVPFPAGNGSITWQSVTPAEAGSDESWNYTKFTTTYGVGFLGGVTSKYGYKTTKREKGSDELTGVDKTDEGWQPLTYTSFGWPSTAKSWIELTYHYSQSGDQVQRVEQVLNYSITAPADTTVVAPDFNLNWANPQLGAEVTVGNNANGNGVTVTSKRQNYLVGATGLFTRRFVFLWETAVWSDGTHTFSMPSPSFTGHSESHTLTDLSPVTGYDRKLATNTASASLNGISGNAPAKTTVKVESTPDTPDDPTDELVSRTVIDEGLTYVNETTNKSWIKIREIWSVSGTTEYTVDINLTNGVTCPVEGPVIVADFNYISQPGAGTTSSEQLVNSYSNGNFTVKVYRKTYTVSLGASVQLVWTGTYEKAVYNPLNHNMPSSTYTYATAVGDYTADLGPTLTQNTTYNRKMWTQNITATLNAHTHQHQGTCEVWALDEIPRESPSWLGDLLDGKYTRIQQGVGYNFKDCVAFKYENGVVLFINGNTNSPLIFAKNATLASQYNVPQMGSYVAWYSAEYHDGGWWPAKITPTGDWNAWTYVADVSNQHTVMRANALELGIGYDYHPIPTHQSFTKNGNVGTISYSANNTSSSMTASITFW